jgi:hypothetical protein
VSFYDYQDVYGQVHELEFPIGTAPDACYMDSAYVVQVPFARRAQPKEFRGVSRGWPIESFSMGVHPDDRFAAMEDAAAHGVPTHYNENGNPEMRNMLHQRRFNKYMKAHNKDSFFG